MRHYRLTGDNRHAFYAPKVEASTPRDVARLSGSVLAFLRKNGTNAQEVAHYVQAVTALSTVFNDDSARSLKQAKAKAFSLLVPAGSAPAVERHMQRILDGLGVSYTVGFYSKSVNHPARKSFTFCRRGNLDNHARLAEFLSGGEVLLAEATAKPTIRAVCDCAGCTFNRHGSY